MTIKDVQQKQYSQFQEILHRSGLELQDNKKQILIEKIKKCSYRNGHYAGELPEIKYSIYIS